MAGCLSVLLAMALPGCKGDDVADGSGSEGEGEGEGEGTGDTGGVEEGETGEEGGEPYVPPPGGMRQILDYQYVNTVRYVFGDQAAAVAAPPADQALHGYTSIGATQLSVPIDTVELYETSALAIADAALANPEALANLAPCVLDAPDQDCYTEVAESIGHVLWRRPLSADEISDVVDIALQAEAWDGGNFEAGLEYELVRLMLSPHFIYVTELGDPESGSADRRWLTGPEAVTRLTFLLIGRTPSLTLLESAEAGNYDTVEALESLAGAMVNDVAAPDAVSEFFGEYLALEAIPAKDPALFPFYSEALVDSMLEETELLLRDVIWTQDTDFRDFFEADYTFIDQNLAELYGMPAPADGTWEMVMLPPTQTRAGFITHASMLARNSHGSSNSTTRRGQYIQQRMLCFAVPPPPPEVNPQVPEIPEDMPMTLREVMEMTHLEVESCASCHKYMEPFGFVLESYDALGEWRTEDVFGLPIDPIVDYEDWGTLSDATDIAANLTMDPRLGRCVVNNIIRFGRGSLEMPDGEGEQLVALYDAFEDSNYRFKQMLVEFVTSELFLQVGAPK